MRKHRKQSGFSLIELAVVIAIISVVVAVGMGMGTDAIKYANRVATQEQMKIVKIAISNYYVRNGVYPCPAYRNFIPGQNANFGESFCTPSGASVIRVGAGVNAMLLGALPVRALQLPDQFAADSWGRKITYAVTEDLTSDPLATGNISVLAGDPASTNFPLHSSPVAYVAFSHGEDGGGAYPYRDNVIEIACIAGRIDSENCDYSDRTFYDAFFNDTEGAFHTDDFMVWGVK